MRLSLRGGGGGPEGEVGDVGNRALMSGDIANGPVYVNAAWSDKGTFLPKSGLKSLFSSCEDRRDATNAGGGRVICDLMDPAGDSPSSTGDNRTGSTAPPKRETMVLFIGRWKDRGSGASWKETEMRLGGAFLAR